MLENCLRPRSLLGWPAWPAWLNSVSNSGDDEMLTWLSTVSVLILVVVGSGGWTPWPPPLSERHPLPQHWQPEPSIVRPPAEPALHSAVHVLPGQEVCEQRGGPQALRFPGSGAVSALPGLPHHHPRTSRQHISHLALPLFQLPFPFLKRS